MFSCVLNAHFQFLCRLVQHVSNCQPEVSAIPTAHLCSTAIRRDIRAAIFFNLWTAPSQHWVYFIALFECAALYFCSCELLWRSSGCVLLPCFNAVPDIFAVTNCSVLALSVVFCSGLLTGALINFCVLQWHIAGYNNEKGECVQNNMHAVSTNFAKSTPNVKKWRHIVKSQTSYIQLHWPPYATPLLNTRIC